MQMDLEQATAQALKSATGLTFTCATPQDAKRLQRQFYSWREQQRQNGVGTYDVLSFTLQGQNFLLINRHNLPSNTPQLNFSTYRTLAENELPASIQARGRSKIGACMAQLYA